MIELKPTKRVCCFCGKEQPLEYNHECIECGGFCNYLSYPIPKTTNLEVVTIIHDYENGNLYLKE